MDNSKNLLQELCQKNGWDLPRYEQKFVGGEPHCPTFISTVTLLGKQYTGSEEKNKKLADFSAAMTALADNNIKEIKEIKEINSDTQKLTKKNQFTLLCFDIENVIDLFNKFVTKYEIGENSNIFAIGFISKGHHMRVKFEKLVKNKNNISLYITDSSVKNAVDYNIVFTIGMIVGNKKAKDFIIITRDSFGSTFKSVIEGSPVGKNLSIKLISHLQDLLQELNDERV